jgi:hypothetical protein
MCLSWCMPNGFLLGLQRGMFLPLLGWFSMHEGLYAACAAGYPL